MPKGIWGKNHYLKGAQLRHKKLFGMEPEDYDELLVKQGFSCAICRKHFTTFKKALSVDHCHETGKVRGLLCQPCNTGLGMFKDNPKVMARALVYLEENGISIYDD